MATDLDISQAASAVYAESLLSLVEEQGQSEAVAEELAQLRALWNQDQQFVDLMSSSAIDEDDRRQSIRKIFGNGRVSKLVFNLLMVLNDKHRAYLLPAVCDAYVRELNKLRGRKEVYVTSAVPLDDPQRARLQAEVKRLSGVEPILVERVDPDVLGGLMVQVGDHLFDATVGRRLHDYRDELRRAVQKHLLGGGASRFITEG